MTAEEELRHKIQQELTNLSSEQLEAVLALIEKYKRSSHTENKHHTPQNPIIDEIDSVKKHMIQHPWNTNNNPSQA